MLANDVVRHRAAKGCRPHRLLMAVSVDIKAYSKHNVRLRNTWTVFVRWLRRVLPPGESR